MLDSYIKYLKSVDNKSLIAKIYGVFTIKTSVYAPLDFIVMQNTANLLSSKNWSVKFDLKGS
jgi:1-phosphatidylinositol-4-phosphate 5-kinase